MNSHLETRLNEIFSVFDISDSKLIKISNSFYKDMFDKTELKMFRTFINLTDNIILGDYLAIDLGGSNIRVSEFSVSNSDVLIKNSVKIPLRSSEFDYTTKEYSLKDLLVMALSRFSGFLDKEKNYFMGVTISFGLDATSHNEAKICDLSKGFRLKDTYGKDIYSIIMEAINDVGLKITPVAIINDAVATMVTGRFYNSTSDIAMITGTGHNSCFIGQNGEIINVESANFSMHLPVNEFDKKCLAKFPDEASKLMEIMIGGKYIGEIAKEVIGSLVEDGLIYSISEVNTKLLVNSLEDGFTRNYSSEQIEVLKCIAKMIFNRAAKLIVAESAAILRFIDSEFSNNHTIVFDGSVYEKCEYFRNELSNEIGRSFGDNAFKISHTLVKDASGMGAAIVASEYCGL